MSHEINKNDTFGYVGMKAWHGLGKELPDGLSAEEGFRQIGLDWDTELREIFTEVPSGIDEMGNPTIRRIPVASHRAQVRTDTDDILGIVSKDYKKIDNREMAIFADAIAGADHAVTLSTAGSLRSGRRIFALIKLPRDIKIGADIVEPYVLVSNGHGGEAAFSIYPTTVRVVCANTLRMSERDAARGIRFTHTGDLESKLQQAKTALNIVMRETEVFEMKAKALAGKQLSGEQLRFFLEKTYDDTFGRLPTADEAGDMNYERMVAKRKDTIEQWALNLDDSRQNLQGIQGSAWAALNAITQWHDHERGRLGPDTPARQHSNLFGASARDKRIAFRNALATI
jgi:phage/plasmid-like protein (TIGR03299 family)